MYSQTQNDCQTSLLHSPFAVKLKLTSSDFSSSVYFRTINGCDVGDLKTKDYYVDRLKV